MNKSLSFLIPILLSSFSLGAQDNPLDPGRFSVSLGLGYVPLSGTGQVAKHFEDHGFDDDSGPGLPFVSSGPEHPDRTGLAVTGQIWLSFRLRQNHRAGILLGTDNRTEVTGFDYFFTENGFNRVGHHVTFQHSSLFVVPTYSYVLADRWALTAGPALNFQAINDNTYWAGPPEQKKTSVGAVLGIDWHLTRGLGLFATGRWLPPVRFTGHTATYDAGAEILTSTLPATDINFSYLAVGLRVRLTAENGIPLLMDNLRPDDIEY